MSPSVESEAWPTKKKDILHEPSLNSHSQPSETSLPSQ